MGEPQVWAPLGDLAVTIAAVPDPRDIALGLQGLNLFCEVLGSCAQTAAVACADAVTAGCKSDGGVGFEDACAAPTDSVACLAVDADTDPGTLDCAWTASGVVRVATPWPYVVDTRRRVLEATLGGFVALNLSDADAIVRVPTARGDTVISAENDSNDSKITV